jgi:asparagine synthase (glutamine-hydrolysing)
VTVCQLGEGADELFWGYPSWKQRLRLQYINDRFPWAMPKRRAVSLLQRWPRLHDNARLEWLRRAGLNQPIFWGGAEAFSELEKQNLLHPRLRAQFSGFSSYEALLPIRKRFEEKAWEKSHLQWMSYLDLNMRLPELLLMRVDKMTMGVSLEGRVPFLDHKFVELAMSIPEDIKTQNGVLKYILKRAVHGLIPDDLITRPKQGFGVPIDEWFCGRLGEQARSEIAYFCAHTDFLDETRVASLIKKGRGQQIWYILNFALWWRQYIDSSGS